jgi:hypothetical protein
MIFNNEIKEISCLLFNTWIKIVTIKCLVNPCQGSFERIILFVSKQTALPKSVFQFLDCFQCFIIGYLENIFTYFVMNISSFRYIFNHISLPTCLPLGTCLNWWYHTISYRIISYHTVSLCPIIWPSNNRISEEQDLVTD